MFLHPKQWSPGRVWGVLRSWALGSLASLWRWFFPPTTDVPDPIHDELARRFPNLDLDRVQVHEGVPLLVRFSWPDAMTVPGLVDTSTIHVYVRPWDLEASDCEPLSYFVHESVHVHQYLAYAGGYGLGRYRAFWYHYLLCALRYGYHRNPLENEAERFEGAIVERCTERRGRIELCCEDVAFRGTDVRLVDQFGRAVPGLPRLWAAVEWLLDRPRPWPGRASGADRDRGLALLAAPFLVGAAGLLSAVGLAYGALFAGCFLVLTVTALTLWYVAKALYVAVTAAWGLVRMAVVAVDALFAGLRRVV